MSSIVAHHANNFAIFAAQLHMQIILPTHCVIGCFARQQDNDRSKQMTLHAALECRIQQIVCMQDKTMFVYQICAFRST